MFLSIKMKSIVFGSACKLERLFLASEKGISLIKGLELVTFPVT
jgi:hypothetical protein